MVRQHAGRAPERLQVNVMGNNTAFTEDVVDAERRARRVTATFSQRPTVASEQAVEPTADGAHAHRHAQALGNL